MSHLHTSSQRQHVNVGRRRIAGPLPVLGGWKKTVEEGGVEVSCGCPALDPVNEVKRAIATELGKLGRPVAAEELHKVCPEGTTQGAIDYHLCTLVMLRAAKPVPSGPELLFQFVGDPDGS